MSQTSTSDRTFTGRPAAIGRLQLTGRSAWPWLFGLALLIPAGLVVAGWATSPPILNPDSAMGFLVWQSRAAGAAWNHILEVNPANISTDRAAFLSWWSPGQYEIPGAWRHLGFTWGHAMLLTALAASWLGTAGAWQLARQVGAGRMAAGCFCAGNALEWHSLFGFGHFRGGDVLLGAATPWLLLWGWSCRRHPWAFCATSPLVLLGSFYLKLSAGLLVFPLLGVTAIALGIRMRSRPRTLVSWSLLSALALTAAWLVIQFGFLARGANPGSAGQVSHALPAAIGFAALAPWMAATGAQSLVGRLLWMLSHNSDAFWNANGPAMLAAAALAWTAGIWWLRKAEKRPLAVSAIVGIVGGGAALMAVLLARGANVALDDRLLRSSAAVLLLVLALHVDRSRLARWCLAGIMTFGVLAAAQRSWRLAKLDVRDAQDLTQQQLSPPALVECAAIDADGARDSTLVYVPSPEIAFNFTRQRVLVTDDINDLRLVKRHGRVRRLVVMVPDAMEATGRGELVRKRFVDYRAAEWHATHHGGWWFWSAGEP